MRAVLRKRLNIVSEQGEMLGYLGSYILFSLAVGAFEIYLDIRQRVTLAEFAGNWHSIDLRRRRVRWRSLALSDPVTTSIGAPLSCHGTVSPSGDGHVESAWPARHARGC